MREAMLSTLLGTIQLPEHDAKYSWHLEWVFEEDKLPAPKSTDLNTLKDALQALYTLVNTSGKTLTHISLSRRNA